MRRPLVAGNWKMNGSRQTTTDLLRSLRQTLSTSRVENVVCPPFPYLGLCAELLLGSDLLLGAQDLHFEAAGAFTGAVSGAMLHDMGCRFVIVGHSERRQYFGETDQVVARKSAAAIAANLRPIVCVGESPDERDAGVTLDVIDRQINAACSGLAPGGLEKTVIAYEPIWAIGTGRTATPGQAQEVHAFIRERLRKMAPESADSVRLLYGGSVKAVNARELFEQPDIDGALVGGASLHAKEYAAICEAAEGS